jgi:hypothetical protein
MPDYLQKIIKKNRGSYILRDLDKLFSPNEKLPDHRDCHIKSSLQNGSGIYMSKKFYKKIAKF